MGGVCACYTRVSSNIGPSLSLCVEDGMVGWVVEWGTLCWQSGWLVV